MNFSSVDTVRDIFSIFFSRTMLNIWVYFFVFNKRWNFNMMFCACGFKSYCWGVSNIYCSIFLMKFSRVKLKKDGFHAKSRIFKKNCSRFPILLLHSDHLSWRTFRAYLVLGGVHPAGRSHSKFCDFSKNVGDVPLWERPHNTYAFGGGGVSDLLRNVVKV
jgi:hypothetical protein